MAAPNKNEILLKIKLRDLFDMDELCSQYPVEMFYNFIDIMQTETDKAILKYVIGKAIELLDNKRVRYNINRSGMHDVIEKLLPLRTKISNVMEFLAILAIHVELVWTYLSHEKNDIRCGFALAALESKKIVRKDQHELLKKLALYSDKMSVRFVQFSFIPYQCPVVFDKMDSYVNVPASVPHFTTITEHKSVKIIRDLVTYMNKTSPVNPKMKEQGISRFFFGPYLKLAEYVLQNMIEILTEQGKVDEDIGYDIFGPMLIEDPGRYTEILLKYVKTFLGNQYTVYAILQAFAFPGVAPDITKKAIKYVRSCLKYYQKDSHCHTLSFLLALYADQIDVKFAYVRKSGKATLKWLEKAPETSIKDNINALYLMCHEKHPHYERRKFIRKLAKKADMTQLFRDVLISFGKEKDVGLIDDVISVMNPKDILVPDNILEICLKDPQFTCTYIEKKGYNPNEHEQIVEMHTFKAITDFNRQINTKDKKRLSTIARLLNIIQVLTPQTKFCILEFISKVVIYAQLADINETGDLCWIIDALIVKKNLFETPFNNDLKECLKRLGEMFKYVLPKRDLKHGAMLMISSLQNNLMERDQPFPKFIGCLSRLTPGCEALGDKIVSMIPNKSFLVKKN